MKIEKEKIAKQPENSNSLIGRIRRPPMGQSNSSDNLD